MKLFANRTSRDDISGRERQEATRGHMAAGRGRSEEQGACEWAEFGDRQAAETCERDLQAMVARFSARLSATRSGWE